MVGQATMQTPKANAGLIWDCSKGAQFEDGEGDPWQWDHKKQECCDRWQFVVALLWTHSCVCSFPDGVMENCIFVIVFWQSRQRKQGQLIQWQHVSGGFPAKHVGNRCCKQKKRKKDVESAQLHICQTSLDSPGFPGVIPMHLREGVEAN